MQEFQSDREEVEKVHSEFRGYEGVEVEEPVAGHVVKVLWEQDSSHEGVKEEEAVAVYVVKQWKLAYMFTD